MKNLKKRIIAPLKSLFHVREHSVKTPKYDFSYDGINYVIVSTSKLEVKVVAGSRKYSGDIVIPDVVKFRGRTMKVVGISRYAFYHCKNLKSINLGNVERIGEKAFEGCVNLYDLNFDKVKYIGRKAFIGCTSLTNIYWGAVLTIEDDAFYNCTNIESLDFINVVSIGNNNFIGCKKLKHLNFWNLKYLGERVFEDCSGITSVYLYNVKTLFGTYVYEDAGKHGVFKNCVNLKSVTLENVKEIKDCAFFGCTNITDITLYSSVPPTVELHAFHHYAYLATLYVPKGSADVYRKHEVWGRFVIEEFVD